jgi:hypothetical protein
VLWQEIPRYKRLPVFVPRWLDLLTWLSKWIAGGRELLVFGELVASAIQ